jgi:hypothetical protein
VWHKYVNAPTSYGTGLTDNSYTSGNLGPLVTHATATLPSGLGENADNKYIYTYLTQEFGQVVAFRAKLPVTPRTRDGGKVMGTGHLRYWSMCSANRTTQTYGCVVDEDVPVDAKGYFTIAVSTTADRPANATPECGVAWLPWGPDPKGIAFVRNMLPGPGFKQAIQNAEPGTEDTTLGPYYPTGRYYGTPVAFERTVGCSPAAPKGVAGTTHRCALPSRLRLKLPTRYGRVRTARVYVDGRLVTVAHGRRLRTVTIGRPARASFSVRIVALTSRRKRVTSTRAYIRCHAGRVRVTVAQ